MVALVTKISVPGINGVPKESSEVSEVKEALTKADEQLERSEKIDGDVRSVSKGLKDRIQEMDEDLDIVEKAMM